MSRNRRLHRSAPRRRGFTLVEILIAIAIVAILAGVALPSYFDSIRKGRRAEAFQAIAAVQQAQERWRNSHSGYADDLTSAAPTGLGLAATTAPGGYYQLAMSDVVATGYTVTASASSGTSQAGDTNCIRLRARVVGGNIFYGAGAATGDFDETNRHRCWTR